MSETVTRTAAITAAARSGTTATSSAAGGTATRRARASIAFGRKRGYYRLLFEAGPVDAATFAELADVPLRRARAWLDEQLAAGVLRTVTAPSGDHDELLLPGEYVPILLGNRADVGDHELDGARALLAEHRGDLPAALDAEPDRRSVLAVTDQARLMRIV